MTTEISQGFSRSSPAPAPWRPASVPDRRLETLTRWRGLGRSSTFPFPQYVADDAHQTVYFDHGEGESLVFVHGLGASLTNWEQIIEPLAEGRRVLGLDLVGCGWTAKPRIDYTVDVLRDHLLGFLERRGVRRATLVGHSMGGAVVLAAAIARPDLVDV